MVKPSDIAGRDGHSQSGLCCADEEDDVVTTTTDLPSQQVADERMQLIREAVELDRRGELTDDELYRLSHAVFDAED